MREVVLSGRFTGLPEHGHALSDLAKAMYADSRAEAACNSYACYVEPGNPQSHIFFERWADQAGLDAHFASPHFSGFMERFPKLIDGAPSITLFDSSVVTEAEPAPAEALIVLAGRFAIKPEQRRAMLDLATSMFAPSRAEAGCVSYDFFEEIGAPNSFLFFERWKNKAALDEHFATPHFARFMEVFPTIVAGELDMTLFAVTAERTL